ncbi:uncharacterized protein LOC108626315 [Ceratina calcarata]|uniref:Uncharacterized protein LOC108626315 n=1 Tax=Ceratina calcarata TaxID=156304 RepID=A0AAJ7J1B6_9HYME|nr:uncharacterized protein LOC108626315 [Ceratina calcarata]
MRDRNLVGGPVVAATKKRKKKKRHLESARYKRNSDRWWLWMRAGVQRKSGHDGYAGGGGGNNEEDSSRQDPSSARSAYDQLDWTASRVFVVRPWVVGATTGAGVGLPLLLLVVAVLGNQTCTTTAAPVVSDPYVSLDATPPRLLPRSTDRSSSYLSSSWRTRTRFSNHQPENLSRRKRSSKGGLDYHEVSSSLIAEQDGVRLRSPEKPTTIDTIGRKDPFSPVLAGRRGGGRGGRGRGGLAHERTKSGRRHVVSLLGDQGSTPLGLVEPSWLPTKFSRFRHVEPSSTLIEKIKPEHRRGTISDLEDYISDKLPTEDRSTITATTTVTTVPIAWTTIPFRLVHRTVPRLPDDDSAAVQFATGRRNRKAKDERGGGVVGVSSRKDVFADGSGEVKGGGGGVVEWTTTVAGPMSSWSYPEDEEPGAGSVRTRPSPEEAVSEDGDEETAGGGEQVKVTVAQAKGSSSTSTTARTTGTSQTTTQLPPPSQDTSMEALSASSYIVSVVLVLIVGALVGVLATVSHHLHHRRLLHDEPASASILDHHRHHHHHHHHHREEFPASHQRRLLLQDYRHPATPMLSVSPGMEVGSGGHGGLGSGGLEGDPSGGGAVVGVGGGGGGEGATEGVQEAMVAAARDRAIRAGSVRQDLALDLPPRLQLPDGEERPYGAHTALHLRDPDQESEIYRKCVRPPPNRTVFDSESPPPYRSQSALLEASRSE